ncbi:hypothetical protein [Sphingobium olei]|uniref:Uncharacterized protein n=1 Tax=Sphingobium olei TaxID=420955 RepID=A0ABW3NV70_9SPHN
MYHWFDLVVNDRTGIPIPDVIARAYDTVTGALADIYADESGTPIDTVSGIANAAKTDSGGNYDFFIDDGNYDVQLFVGSAPLKVIRNVQMKVAATLGDLDGKTNASAVGVSGTATNLGTGWVGIVPDNPTAKQAVQAVETQLIDRITANSTPTTDGYVTQFRNSPTTGQDIYSAQVPAGYYYRSATRSAINIQPGTTVQHMSAFDAYAINNATHGSAPNEANAVCYFGQAVAAVDNAHVWGINTACNDSVGNVSGAGVGRVLIGWEHDVDVNRTGTTVVGASMIIQGSATPLNADAYQVGTRGSATKWSNGFITDDASCTVAAIQVGASAASGSDIASQQIFMSFRDGSSARHQLRLNASNSALNLAASTTADMGYFQITTGNIIFGVSGASTDINIQYLAKGLGTHIFNAPIRHYLASSVTPNANSQMMFELTSNTSLTVKVRGSDGVTRSAVLALT